MWNSTVAELVGEKKLSSIKINTEGKLHDLVVDGVFVSIGRRPATEFLKDILPLDEVEFDDINDDDFSNMEIEPSLPLVFAEIVPLFITSII